MDTLFLLLFVFVFIGMFFPPRAVAWVAAALGVAAGVFVFQIFFMAEGWSRMFPASWLLNCGMFFLALLVGFFLQSLDSFRGNKKSAGYWSNE